jgi:segregation and condensation protein A
MQANQPTIFTLENFEGPLDFLVHLIQKNEIDISEVPIKIITDQYLQKTTEQLEIEKGAEFISLAALLILLKSKHLLPREQTEDQLIEEVEPDPAFNLIHQLIDYCQFKEAAKLLAEREAQQQGLFTKGCDEIGDPQKPFGLGHLSLEDLAKLFQQVLVKAKGHYRCIEEENWRVADKITLIRQLIVEQKEIAFTWLFSIDKSREELIVTFLAILELMKLGEVLVIQNNENIIIRHGQRN